MKFIKRKINNLLSFMATIVAISLCVMCSEGSDTGNDGSDKGSEGSQGEDSYEDIKVVDGKVRFYISEKDNATRTASGLSARNWKTSKLIVNGRSYTIQLTDDET